MPLVRGGPSSPVRDATCWHCDHEVPEERLRVETVIHARSAPEGGPYHSIHCLKCGCECGVACIRGQRVESDRYGLYPLTGTTELGPLDWVGTREERERRRRARAWWVRHETAMRAFAAQAHRSVRAHPRTQTATRPPPRDASEQTRNQRRTPPPQPPPPRPPRDQPEPPPRPPPPRPPPAEDSPPQPASTDPRTLLGIGPDAPKGEIARAYRAALKRCHPDRVANMDRDFQELAHRKAKALRAAYETLLRGLD